MFALIDGDILVYKTGFAVQKLIHMGFDIFGTKILESPSIKDIKANTEVKTIGQRIEIEPLQHALYLVKLIHKKILQAVEATDYRIYLTNEDIKENFRTKIPSSRVYKGNRKAARPEYYDQIRQYLLKHYQTELVTGIEADDMLGIMQMELNQQNIPSIICSIDKDLLQIPGLHYNIDKHLINIVIDPGRVYKKNWQLKGEGIVWCYAQCLLGDTADNIQGLAKYGTAKVYKMFSILGGITHNIQETLHYFVRALYLFKGRTEEEFNNTFKLCYILRSMNEIPHRNLDEVF